MAEACFDAASPESPKITVRTSLETDTTAPEIAAVATAIAEAFVQSNFFEVASSSAGTVFVLLDCLPRLAIGIPPSATILGMPAQISTETLEQRS